MQISRKIYSKKKTRAESLHTCIIIARKTKSVSASRKKTDFHIKWSILFAWILLWSLEMKAPQNFPSILCKKHKKLLCKMYWNTRNIVQWVAWSSSQIPGRPKKKLKVNSCWACMGRRFWIAWNWKYGYVIDLF